MITAYLEWALLVECPSCKEELDLADSYYDTGGDVIAKAIFTNDWTALNGLEICCEMCSHDFLLENVEY